MPSEHRKPVKFRILITLRPEQHATAIAALTESSKAALPTLLAELAELGAVFKKKLQSPQLVLYMTPAATSGARLSIEQSPALGNATDIHGEKLAPGQLASFLGLPS